MGEPATENFQIDRFQVVRTIAETDFSEVFEVCDNAGKAYCLKRLKRNAVEQTSEMVVSFRREAKLLAQVQHPNVLRVEEVGDENGIPFLVLELVEGESLSDLIKKGELIPVSEALDIAMQVAAGLVQIHEQGILHRDIKPDNILIDTIAGRRHIKISDLGLAGQSGSLSKGFSGTLLYISPEQAGLVNWPQDVPSDMYSLGATLYELLTGRPPFTGADTASLFSAHLSKTPERLSKIRPEVPPLVDRIVMKCLAKRPEMRYQSADGLLHDLKEAQERLHQSDISANMELDSRSRQHLRVGKVFVGREKELEKLKQGLRAAETGRLSAIFVGGLAGTGKSALLREFENQALVEGAKFAYGKCYEFAKALPCYCLGEALEDFLNKLKRYPSSSRNQIINKISDTVGNLGAELVRIAPSYAELLPPTKELKYLGEGKDRQRFLDLVFRLVKALSHKGAPLILLLDDLQWADRVVLDVIDSLIRGQQECSVLLLGTYRSEEVGEDHPLQKILQGDKENLPVVNLPLSTFDVSEVHRLTAKSLGHDETALPPQLSDFVHSKSEGNALFVAEILKALLSEGVLHKQADDLEFDREMASSIDLPGSTVEMVLRRLRGMDDSVLNTLGRAALIGTGFTYDEICHVSALAPDRVYEILQLGIHQQVLKIRQTGEYEFFHDRIHEACTHLISDEEKPSVHQVIVEYLESRSGVDADYFKLAEHAIRAQDRSRIERYCLKAGDLAQGRHANEEAYSYYKLAYDQAQKAARENESEAIKIRQKLASVLVALGRYEEARSHFEQLMDFARDDVTEKVRLMAKVAECLQREGHYDEGRDTLVKALVILRSPLRSKNYWLWNLIDQVRIFWFLFWRRFVPVSNAKKERLSVTAEVLTRLWMVHVVHDMSPLLHISYRLLAVGARMGRSEELAVAHQYMSLTLANQSRPPFEKAIRHAQRAVEVGRAVKADEVVAGSMVRLAAINTWRGQFGEALVYAERAREMLLALGNLWDLGNAIIFSFFCRRNRGALDEAAGHAFSLIKLGERTGSFGLMSSGHCKVAEVLFIRGEEISAEEHIQAAIQVSEDKGLSFDMFQAYKTRGFMKLHQGRVKEAGEYYAMAVSLIEDEKKSFFKAYTNEAYLGRAESLLRDPESFEKLMSSPDEVDQLEKQLEKAEAMESFYQNLGHVFRVRALWLSLEKRADEALENFNRAHELFTKQERPFEVALCEMDTGLALSELRPKEAAQSVRRALSKFSKLGATSFAEKCRRALILMGELGDVQDESESSRDSGELVRALLEVSLASASSLEPVEQSRAILDKTIQMIKAERAFVFMNDPATGEKRFLLGRDYRGNDVENPEGYSTTLVKKIASTRQPLVVAGTAEGVLLGAHSAVANNLLSMVGAPLLMKDELLGVLYLDNRLEKGMYTDQDASMLQAIANMIGVAFHMSQMAQMKVEKKTLEKNLEVTGAVQSLLLPSQPDFTWPEADVASYYKSADHSGGDWWWCQKNGTKLKLILGDVTGHGAGSAMVTAMVAGSVQTMQREDEAGIQFDGAQFLSRLNDNLHALCQGKYWMTMHVIEIDFEHARLRAWFAGAPMLQMQTAEGKLICLSEKGSALGGHEAKYGLVEQEFRPGDCLMAFTDGIYEQRRARGNTVGVKRLSRWLQRAGHLSAGQARDEISQQFFKAKGDMPMEDDVSFVVVKRK